MALEILRNNDVNILYLLIMFESISGNGKNCNLIITGPANCGKTFFLNSLNTILSTFTNPSSCKSAFVGVEKKELMLLNDL